MKRKTAKDILVDSFRELVEVMPVDKISVQDIAANCDYSVATFYRYFRDKYDLISWIYANSFQEMIKKSQTMAYTWQDSLRDGLLLCQKNKNKIANLIQNTHGHDSFIRTMININAEELKKYILKKSHKEMIEKSTELCIRGYCAGMVTLLCEWLLGTISISFEEMEKLFILGLPEPIKILFREE
jgi:AcrR family transcriptional regulator